MPDGRAPVSLRGILRWARHALVAIAARVRTVGRAQAPVPEYAAVLRGAADPRLAGTDPVIAAYVEARDPDWFSIDVDAPEQDTLPPTAHGPAPEPDAGTTVVASTAPATSNWPDARATEPPAASGLPNAAQVGLTGTPARTRPAAARTHPVGDVANGDVAGHEDPAGMGPRSAKSTASIRFQTAAATRSFEPTGATPVVRGPDRTPTTQRPAFRRVDPVTSETRPIDEHDSEPRSRESHTNRSPIAEPRSRESHTNRSPIAERPASGPNPPPPLTSAQPSRERPPIAPRFPRPGTSRSPDRGPRADSSGGAKQTPVERSAMIDGPWPTGHTDPAEPRRSPWPKLPESSWSPGYAVDRQRGSVRAWAATLSDDVLILEQRST